jgi:hypothetical protein
MMVIGRVGNSCARAVVDTPAAAATIKPAALAAITTRRAGAGLERDIAVSWVLVVRGWPSGQRRAC